MNDIDQKIQAALRRDPATDALAGEPNLAEEILTAFRGRHRWLSTLMFIVNLVAFAGLVYAVVRFYDATEVAMQLRWGGLALWLMGVVSMLKVWFWLEMHTNRVLREVKRVELLLVSRPQK
ncbi:MAG TPA: DUF6768 family protein [Opitutaceae bacterium]|nr:DUF6768 family protein [Opitutaceae bacterium]